MPRAIWKGQISFGLVNIPVSLYSAERRADLHFNLIDSKNKAKIRYERVNEVTGEEVPWDRIIKGYEYDDGNYVLLEKEDFEKAAVEATQTIDLEDFVYLKEIDKVFFDKPYYLTPGKRSEKGYVLLRETLKNSGRVGIAKVVIRTRQYISALVPEGDALMLILLRFEREIKDLEEFDFPSGELDDYKISKKEIDMAEQLIDTMSAEWDPSKYRDEYREKLMDWIEKKAHDEKLVQPAEFEGEEAKPANVVDMMDILKQSVEESEKKRKSKRKKSSG